MPVVFNEIDILIKFARIKSVCWIVTAQDSVGRLILDQFVN